MSRAVTIQTNFTTGEVDPLLKSRIDIQQYYNALDKARNVLVQPQGGVDRRPGLQYIDEIPSAASPANGTLLVPFTFSTTQSYMLLFVNNRMYVYKDKELVTNINGSGNDYLTTTIGSSLLSTMNYTQSVDTLILVHEDMTPFKVVRGASHSTWTISAITFDFVPQHAFTITTTSGAHNLTPSAVDGNVTLSTSGGAFAASNVGDYVEATNGIGRARIVKYISSSEVDAVVEIPFFDTDAIGAGDWFLESGYEETWSASRGYPRTAVFHEGRLYFGGTKERPNTLFGSRVNRFFDFNPGEALDDDAIEATLDTGQANPIIGLFSGRDLQIFTKGGEFFVPQASLDPITPSNIVVNGATKRGGKEGLRPVGVESGTIFIQESGKAIREFLFSDTDLNYVSNNLSLLSSHLISTPTDMALRKATSTTEGDLLIVINANGTAITYTMVKDQNITAASLASTDGEFVNVAVDVETVYFVVKRNINSTDVYYVEAFNDDNTTDSAILLSGVTLPGTTTVTGLDHLEGETVKVIVDDAMQSDKTVSSGGITLDAVPTSYVEIGMNYTPTITTMPMELKLPSGNTVGQKKRIIEATALLYLSQNLTLDGKDFVFTAANFFTGKKRRKPMLGYNREGQMTFSQSQPLFFNLIGIEFKVSVGQ